MEEAIRARKCVEQGIRTDTHQDGDDEMIYSNYFDLGMVMDYWGPERLNHHTEATSMLFAARECARIMLEEGMDALIARHELHGRAMLAGIQGMGLEVFGDIRHKMNNVLGVMIPLLYTVKRCASACWMISILKSAPRLARCRARSGVSAPWGITRAKIACCKPSQRWKRCLTVWASAPYRVRGCRPPGMSTKGWHDDDCR
jgi:hypothetical protein